ncbi:hypothetical protein BH18ACT2_BH18ACT2_09380 [soil metagenome]
MIDIDETALRDAKATLRTTTINDTVNAALRIVAEHRRRPIGKAIDVLAEADVSDRELGWR